MLIYLFLNYIMIYHKDIFRGHPLEIGKKIGCRVSLRLSPEVSQNGLGFLYLKIAFKHKSQKFFLSK